MSIHIGITALSLNNDLQQRKKTVAGSDSSWEALYIAVLYYVNKWLWHNIRKAALLRSYGDLPMT